MSAVDRSRCVRSGSSTIGNTVNRSFLRSTSRHEPLERAREVLGTIGHKGTRGIERVGTSVTGPKHDLEDVFQVLEFQQAVPRYFTTTILRYSVVRSVRHIPFRHPAFHDVLCSSLVSSYIQPDPVAHKSAGQFQRDYERMNLQRVIFIYYNRERSLERAVTTTLNWVFSVKQCNFRPSSELG